MTLKLKIKPKIAYLTSIFVILVFLIFFSYKALIAYLIHRELYGGGLDVIVLLRASIAGIMFLLILQTHFLKMPRSPHKQDHKLKFLHRYHVQNRKPHWPYKRY